MKEQVEVRELKEGRYVIIDEEPCIIKSISHSKPGKHGSAKARVDAIGIFDNQKKSIVQPVTTKIYVPTVERKTGQVLSIGDTSVQLMDLGSYATIDVPLTEDQKSKIEEGKEVAYLAVMGRMKLDIR
ncbi:MAG: translation initiation factor IF-5A [Methanothrix sp.]|jgi:translation initiation factor 5A|uniref:translation initiation factor IF-5A n=1 Tax=Methanothrix sp. TaxID=90426 RepID=UPI0025CC8BBA|nr:translation initiation factor IF-5A [Methanothrix sp.]MCK9405542.1 translation initiation factor IF-5A [Methanothrix sp.]MDQ1311583.1 translation initiation factor [Euryarchaeota archaeon]